MRAAIVYKRRDVAEDVEDFLKSIDVECRLYESPSDELEDYDFIVSVGGDGTILRILQHLRRSPPIFGINTGRVGLLTHATPVNFRKILADALRNFEVEEFPRLSCRVGEEELLALNEIALFATEVARMIEAEIKIDGKTFDILRCDGIIVATQIGSTGYALSTGGPVVEPRVEAMIVTAVAPFRIGWRPIVLSMERRVEVLAEGVAIADGQKRVRVERIEVVKSKYPAVFFKKERLSELLDKIKGIS